MTPDLYRYFRIEARELTEALIKGLMALEAESVQPETVAHLMRCAHTLKGAAGVVKQPEIAALAHAIEDGLEPLRSGGTPVSAVRIDGLLRHLDDILGRVAALGQPATMSPPTAETVVPAPEADAEALRMVRADVGDVDALLDVLTALGGSLGVMRRAADAAGHIRRRAAGLMAGMVAGGMDSGVEGLGQEIQALIGAWERDVTTSIERAERQLQSAHGKAEAMRLLPIAVLFGTLERTVRDAALTTGKRATFVANGGDVRLDAQVIAVVKRALVQIVRNAVAHGIETVEERTGAQKSPTGRVDLQIRRSGARIVFRCSDDGRGIDRESVCRAAVALGRLDPTQDPATVELLPLLLDGGLSTSGAVTPVAGRGVGLDVVRTVAAELGGEISLQTEPGRGTVLELVVPALLTSQQALIVEAGDLTAAIPLDAVRRTVRLTANDLYFSPDGVTSIQSGVNVPFMPLACTLGQTTLVRDRSWSAVLVETEDRRALLGVDRLLGPATVTVQPLPPLAAATPVVLGTAMDIAGQPRIVLDPAELIARASQQEGPSDPAIPERLPALIIDDSLTTRMLVQSILETAGYRVDCAASGEEGLAMVRQRRYGICLVDVEMPGMDGFTFVERLKADPSLAGTPAIMVTSRDSPEDRLRGRTVGAAGYFPKGEFDQAVLLAAIARLME